MSGLDDLIRMASGPSLTPKPKPPPIVAPATVIDVEELRNLTFDDLSEGERGRALEARRDFLKEPDYWYAACWIAKGYMEEKQPFGFKLIAEQYRWGVWRKPDGSRPGLGKHFTNTHTAYVAYFISHFWPDVTRLATVLISPTIDTTTEEQP